ncbi:MAG: DUF433 domain-containing protein [Rhodomicrobium sp.]
MAHVLEKLTTTEAAVVACVTVRDVNRLYDEKMLPEELLLRSFIRENHDRFVASWACAIIAFYFAAADKLTASERLKAISATAPRVSDVFLDFYREDGHKYNASAKLNWLPSEKEYSRDWLVFSDAFLKIDLAPVVCDVKERLIRLFNAKRMVTSDPEILSGTPVITGTRVPVYDVAASVEKGIEILDILDAYPSLTAKQVELAAFYAKAVPPRGRPKRRTLPKGARIVTDRRLPRRNSAK